MGSLTAASAKSYERRVQPPTGRDDPDAPDPALPCSLAEAARERAVTDRTPSAPHSSPNLKPPAPGQASLGVRMWSTLSGTCNCGLFQVVRSMLRAPSGATSA